jgi:hypothetical protein
MATTPIDLLLRPPEASLPDVVAALRDIYNCKSLDAPPPSAPHSGQDLPSPALVSRVILDAIARGNEDLAQLLAPLNREAAFEPEAVRRYSALRNRLDRLEQDARQHAAVVDRFLNHDPSTVGQRDGAVPSQETLYLQCQRAGRTAGRFRCVNRRSHRASVTLSPRPFTINGVPQTAAPIMGIRPDSFALAPGASAMLTVEVDLGSCPDLLDNLQTSIDLHMNNAIALKIWIEIDVYDRC